MADSNPKPKPSSVSNLLCQEDKSYLIDENQNKPIPSSSNLIINPHLYPIDDGDDDDYVQILVYKERNSPVFLYNYPPYLKDFRVHAVNWILNAQKTFGLKNQTAYLSLIYMDRFLSRKLISENQRWVVDLLSIASLSLATKMDESNVRPSFADYQRLVEDYTFADRVIQDMELAVLNCLEWRMNLNTPFVFINYFIKELGDQHTNHDELISRANDLIMALIKECNSMDDYGPFVVAGAAVLAAFNWQSSEQDLKVKISTVSLWEISDNQQQKQQQEEELIGCYKILQRLCNNANPSTPYTEVELRATTPTRLAGTKRNLSFRDTHQDPDLPD